MGKVRNTNITAQASDLKRLIAEMGRLRPLRDPISALETDLTPSQLHTVLWLGADGPLPASVIAQRVGCGGPTMTGVIDRLEKLAYVKRERRKADRRVVHVRLTPKGARLFGVIDARVSLRLEMLLSLMGADDRAHMLRILGNIVDVLHQARGDSQ